MSNQSGPARAALFPRGRDHLDDADAHREDDQRVEPVRARESPEPLAVHALKVARPSAIRLVLEDDFSVVPEDENGFVTRVCW